MGDVEMTTPTKVSPRRLHGTPVTRSQSRKFTPNVEYSLRSSATSDLLTHSPMVTPRRPAKENSPFATPSSAQRHGININENDFDEDSSLMRTPTRNGNVSPPMRPSKRRTRVARMCLGKGMSVDISTAPVGKVNDEDSPSSHLAELVDNCSIKFKRISMPMKDAKSPPRTPRSSRKEGNKVSRILHRVQAKISK